MAKTKSGAAPGAPKPKIEPRKTPVTKRPWFRWTALGAVGLLVLIIVLLVLGSAGRKSTLRAFDTEQQEALQPFQAHREQSAPQSYETMPQQFSAGQVTPEEFRKAAERWTTDFTEAATNVRGLDAPEQLETAQELIARALENHSALALLYASLADTKAALADLRGAEEKQRNALATRIGALDTQIQGLRTQANNLFALGLEAVDDLKREWGITPETDPLSDLGNVPGIPT